MDECQEQNRRYDSRLTYIIGNYDYKKLRQNLFLRQPFSHHTLVASRISGSYFLSRLIELIQNLICDSETNHKIYTLFQKYSLIRIHTN